MNWEILIGKTVVGKITSEPVYWNSGYHYYHFSPAAGFAEISSLINQVKLAIESGDDAEEDSAYEQMRGIPFMLRSPQGRSLEKGSFDLYMVQEDEVRIRLLEPAWGIIKATGFDRWVS